MTETSLAMTMFRDEIGGWFLVMFVSLLAGRVWNWIGEGRVEFIEQQPPANPRLFYSRLFISLSVSVLYDLWMMNYCLDTVLDEAKPGMMVMFAFEFAVLMISSLSTFIRYILILNELYVVEQQTKAKLEARRAEVRAAREQAVRDAGPDGTVPSNLPREEDIDESEIDVPGWEEKGRWIFYLDLATGKLKASIFLAISTNCSYILDFFKLLIYVAFFAILTSFHGLPIHIMRDVFLTARSFGKRIYDFMRYRTATRDMNERYPDATAAELQNDNTCIVCREDMRPWSEPHVLGARADLASHERMNQRLRAKKLPCGHILHFGCLRSWLERQQVCPTCRRSVLSTETSSGGRNGQQNNQNAPNRAGGRQNANQNDRGGIQHWSRNFSLGRFRLTLGSTRATPQQLAELRAGRLNHFLPSPQLNNMNTTGHPTNTGIIPGNAGSSLAIQLSLLEIERQILTEIRNLRNTHEQMEVVRRLQGELERLRGLQSASSSHISSSTQDPQPSTSTAQPQNANTSSLSNSVNMLNMSSPDTLSSLPRAFSIPTDDHAMGSDHPNLPAGMSLPQGWSVLPLEPINLSSPLRPAPQNSTTLETGVSQPIGGSSQQQTSSASTNAVGPTSAQPVPTRTTAYNTTRSGSLAQQNQSSSKSTPDQNTKTPPSNVFNDSSSTSAPNAASSTDIPKSPGWNFSGVSHTSDRTNHDNGANGTIERSDTMANGGFKDKGKGKAVSLEDGDME